MEHKDEVWVWIPGLSHTHSLPLWCLSRTAWSSPMGQLWCPWEGTQEFLNEPPSEPKAYLWILQVQWEICHPQVLVAVTLSRM